MRTSIQSHTYMQIHTYTHTYTYVHICTHIYTYTYVVYTTYTHTYIEHKIIHTLLHTYQWYNRYQNAEGHLYDVMDQPESSCTLQLLDILSAASLPLR